MTTDLLDALDQAEAALRARMLPRAALHIREARAAGARLAEGGPDPREAERYRTLLDRTARLVQAEGVRPVADEALDAIMSVVGARRGVVGRVAPTGWRPLVVRHQDAADAGAERPEVSSTVIAEVLQTGQEVVVDDAAQDVGARSMVAFALRSIACLPLRDGDRLLGFVYLDHAGAHGFFDAAALHAVRAWLPVVADAVARTESAARAPSLPGVLTRSPALRAQLAELARVARFDAAVLLSGETGTGKSLIAQQVHAASPRAEGPFVHVNCGAIPESLIEGELFGAEAGAYTGARSRRIGRFEAARGGTVFLDELNAMPIGCQAKLLVALQERTITRLGSNTPVPIDVRVVAATSGDPAAAIAAGTLREDLYYRLAVFVAQLPPLRARPEDIPLLARHILQQTAARFSLPPLQLSAAAEAQLIAHTWPGNVRELENALDRAALLSRDGLIQSITVGEAPARPGAPRSQTGLRGGLSIAAHAVVSAMVQRPELRDLGLTRVFPGAVIEALIARMGDADAAFRFLGLDHQVSARNHTRTVRRETGRLERLAELVGEERAPGE